MPQFRFYVNKDYTIQWKDGKQSIVKGRLLKTDNLLMYLIISRKAKIIGEFY